MPITLEDLRSYAAETASADLSSARSDREIVGWVNRALSRLWSEHRWRWAQDRAQLTLLPEETGSGLTVTQGSRTISLSVASGETFAAKHVDDKWSLIVSGEENFTLRLSELVDARTAKLASDQLWIRASASDQSYTLARYHYTLPERVRELQLVRDTTDYSEVMGLTPSEFDRIRSHTPTERGGDTHYYTIRRSSNEIEVWPGPGASYQVLEITYRTTPPRYLSSDPNDTVVDWPVDKRDLLEAAILVEACITQGEGRVVETNTAEARYRNLLGLHRAEDSGISTQPGPMTLRGYPRKLIDNSRRTYPGLLP